MNNPLAVRASQARWREKLRQPEPVHRQLSMKREYIVWTVRGLKTATTRMSYKPLGVYTLGTRGKNYHFDDWGVIVQFEDVIEWTMATVSEGQLRHIAVDLEHFKDTSEFISVLKKLSKNRRDGKVLDSNTPLYTHIYRLVFVPEKIKCIYEGEVGGVLWMK